MQVKIMETKKKIIAVHLLNDFSGSPLIFSQAINGLQQAGNEVVLHTSVSKDGFLNNIKVNRVDVPYKFYKNNFARLTAFMWSQVILFFQILKYRNEDVIIYINTLLPFGAALAGKVMGKRVVYHLHESYIRPALLKNFLKKIASSCADTALYVSNYLLKVEPLAGIKNEVVYNALPDEFVERAGDSIYHPLHYGQFNVLMICSLKSYKGVDAFIALAKRHPKINFDLVLNAAVDEVADLIHENKLPKNIIIHSTQRNLHPFYRRASLVMNLTNPDFCIETFGMTLLEAMCYGVPVIAPNIGGPVELVEPGKNGFTVDVRKNDELDVMLNRLFTNPEECTNLSEGALATASKFNTANLKNSVNAVIEK